MRTTSRLSLAFVALSLVALPAFAEDFHWQGRVAPGRTVEIKGINGGIEARPADGAEVEVTARKRGRASELDEVKVEVVEHEGGVTVCAVYPSRWSKPS